MHTIKVTIRGFPVEVSDPAAALELIRLAEAQAAVLPESKVETNGKEKPAEHAGDISHSDPGTVRLTVDFLKVIQSGGAAGVASDKIVAGLGVAHGRAIGGRLALINKTLESSGLPPRDVYSNKKSQHGRVWKSRKHLETAIQKLEARLRAI